MDRELTEMESWGTVKFSLERGVLSDLIEIELLDAELWTLLTLVETEDTEVDNWWAISDSWLIEVKLSWCMDEKALLAELESLLADIESECPEEKSIVQLRNVLLNFIHRISKPASRYLKRVPKRKELIIQLRNVLLIFINRISKPASRYWKRVPKRKELIVQYYWEMFSWTISMELASLLADIESEYPDEENLLSDWEYFSEFHQEGFLEYSSLPSNLYN